MDDQPSVVQVCFFDDYIIETYLENKYFAKFLIREKDDLQHGPDELEVAKGIVKWDGCIDWFLRPKNCSAHACDLRGVRAFGAAVEQAYTLCRALLREAGTWDSPYADIDNRRPLPGESWQRFLDLLQTIAFALWCDRIEIVGKGPDQLPDWWWWDLSTKQVSPERPDWVVTEEQWASRKEKERSES